MMHTKSWTVEVFLAEDDEDRTTRAKAVLTTGEAADVVAHGIAYRNPHDLNVAEIGDEVAAARALAALAKTLLGTAASDITAVTSVPAALTL